MLMEPKFLNNSKIFIKIIETVLKYILLCMLTLIYEYEKPLKLLIFIIYVIGV